MLKKNDYSTISAKNVLSESLMPQQQKSAKAKKCMYLLVVNQNEYVQTKKYSALNK